MKEETAEKKSWLVRLKEGLKKSSSKFTQGLSDVLTKKKIEEEMMIDIED